MEEVIYDIIKGYYNNVDKSTVKIPLNLKWVVYSGIPSTGFINKGHVSYWSIISLDDFNKYELDGCDSIRLGDTNLV